MQKRRHQNWVYAKALQKKALGKELTGSVHMWVLAVLMAFFVSGGMYLYSVNQSAVAGYHIRTLENEIEALKDDNTKLKITEADLRSLYRIEAEQGDLQMQKLDQVKYLEKRGPVALK